jgi:hypothetical protein
MYFGRIASQDFLLRQPPVSKVEELGKTDIFRLVPSRGRAFPGNQRNGQDIAQNQDLGSPLTPDRPL